MTAVRSSVNAPFDAFRSVAALMPKAKKLIVHRPNPRTNVVTVVDETPAPTGLGIGWKCRHTMDMASSRCIRCCILKPKHYVLCIASGGTPARYRWLCEPCLGVYEGLGLAAGHRKHVEGFSTETDGYGARATPGVDPDRTRFGLFKAAVPP